MINLESYLIPAMESDNAPRSINEILKKYPIKYPKELDNYQFDEKGNFTESMQNTVEEFFFKSDWEERFNNILQEALSLSKYQEKVKRYCEKSDYNVEDFKIDIYHISFGYYRDDVRRNQLYLHISFETRMDRYDAQGFPQFILPILNEIVHVSMGNQWIIENVDYPTRFTIYRPLTSSEIRSLREIQKRNASVKNKEIDEKLNKFYSMPLTKQISHMFEDIISENGWYECDVDVKINEKRLNLNDGDKLFHVNFHKLNVIGVANKDSNYKKLKKLYYLDYGQLRCITVKQYFERFVNY